MVYSEKFSMKEAGHVAREFMREKTNAYWVLMRETEKGEHLK